MRAAFGNPIQVAIENDRQVRRGTDKIVGRKFGRVAKILWPEATAATVATIGGASVRTAERWMAGEFEPPGVVLAAAILEMIRIQ